MMNDLFDKPGYPYAMAKMGRPRKPRSERVEKFIRVRVSADDERSITLAAKANGLDRSKWARATLIAASRESKITEDVGIEPHRRVNAES
jgi:uncharacterized protein (DUF1778 family)